MKRFVQPPTPRCSGPSIRGSGAARHFLGQQELGKGLSDLHWGSLDVYLAILRRREAESALNRWDTGTVGGYATPVIKNLVETTRGAEYGAGSQPWLGQGVG